MWLSSRKSLYSLHIEFDFRNDSNFPFDTNLYTHIYLNPYYFRFASKSREKSKLLIISKWPLCSSALLVFGLLLLTQQSRCFYIILELRNTRDRGGVVAFEFFFESQLQNNTITTHSIRCTGKIIDNVLPTVSNICADLPENFRQYIRDVYVIVL